MSRDRERSVTVGAPPSRTVEMHGVITGGEGAFPELEDPSNAVVDGLVARSLERSQPVVRWCIVCQRRVEMVADEHGVTCSCCGGRYQDVRLGRR